ncbi:baculoviral IAP repeat-containing protein 7-B-like [Pecten maximus]|uniref:baculoviral IAP repeat-containing protein 7-B-like n=1 Tax=Pecten maximus TaxID=6579 RepID=UPI00145818C7|nr:baculoviral IAP repeat-containing protein 7-B-like [Pecten maximus]
MSDPKRTPPFTPPGQQTNSFTHTQTPNSAARSVPRYPQYSDVWTRLNTFYNFPRNSNQSTRSLAEAGFFYNGKSDCVWCFFCGGPLSNWKSDDDPWIEHARWYPDCHYLQGRRGQQYIEMWNQPQPGESTNGLRELPDRYRDNATQNQLSRTDQPQSRHHSFEVLRPPTSHSLQTGAISDAYERGGPRPHHQNTYSQRQFPQRYTPEGKSQVAVKLNNTHTRKHERSGTRNLALSAPKPSAREDSRIRPIRGNCKGTNS